MEQEAAMIERLSAENRQLRDQLARSECSNRRLGQQVIALAEERQALAEEKPAGEPSRTPAGVPVRLQHRLVRLVWADTGEPVPAAVIEEALDAVVHAGRLLARAPRVLSTPRAPRADAMCPACGGDIIETHSGGMCTTPRCNG